MAITTQYATNPVIAVGYHYCGYDVVITRQSRKLLRRQVNGKYKTATNITMAFRTE